MGIPKEVRDYMKQGAAYLLYFVQEEQDASSPIKIGYTCDLYKRLANLQSGNWRKIKCLGTVRRPRLECQSLEEETHAKFKKDRISGEWYKATPELLEFIRKILEENKEELFDDVASEGIGL